MELGKFNFENKGSSLAELGVASYAYTYQDMLVYIDWIESKSLLFLVEMCIQDKAICLI